MALQRTLILIKPDAIQRRLAGKILSRFEEDGFSVIKMRKGRMSQELALKQYRSTETQLTGMGKKTLESMTVNGHGSEVQKLFGTTDPYKIGEQLITWNRSFMTSNDIIAMILERDNAVLRGRELIGKTDPSMAVKGTIRGDFGDDSILNANLERRATRNLVHASDEEGAAIEVKLFENEFFD
ncbi:MAG: nucleoside-diphosphate kinase [Candidatus Parvarchaeota archaeon]|nr:nucleoside-diphosphate kinase [Candidatus Parvarchaeota archaeon]MCL5101118.1 nucleoside-diphosphate kinase [Candidatus Parvarchaeota archaeon]